MFWSRALLDERGNTVWRDQNGERIGNTGQARGLPRRIRVRLNIAHLDHVPGHDDDSNLRALCDWCHLNYDQLQHKRTRSARKDRARPLLAYV